MPLVDSFGAQTQPWWLLLEGSMSVVSGQLKETDVWYPFLPHARPVTEHKEDSEEMLAIISTCSF